MNNLFDSNIKCFSVFMFQVDLSVCLIGSRESAVPFPHSSPTYCIDKVPTCRICQIKECVMHLH